MLMRGTDFRAPTTGLALVMDRGLESERDVQQALGRVGRFGEKCRRLAVTDVNLIDPDLNLKLKRRLIEFLDSPPPLASLAPRPHPSEANSRTRAQKMIETANSLPKQEHVDRFFKTAPKK